MTYIKIVLLFIALSIVTIGNTQDIFGRRKKDLVEYRTYKMGGWMFAPGLTYTPARVPKSDERDINPNGRLAVYAEVGRFQIFYEGGRFFNYFDYSLAY